jgi:hypothetical protein
MRQDRITRPYFANMLSSAQMTAAESKAAQALIYNEGTDRFLVWPRDRVQAVLTDGWRYVCTAEPIDPLA